MADKKYVVAPGASFVGNNRSYKEGDEIDESAFKSPDRFKHFISCKPPKIIEGSAKAKQEADAEAEAKAKAEAEARRKALEELALKDNFMKPEEIKALKDEELEKKLKDAGKLK